MSSFKNKGFTLLELLLGFSALVGVMFIVWSVVSPLFIQSSKVSASSVMSAYQGYLEENLNLLEVWLNMATDLQSGNLPAAAEIKIGPILLAKHPQNNPVYLDASGGICADNNESKCFFKLEFEIKNFGTSANPIYKYAYRLFSTNSSKVRLQTGAAGRSAFQNDDFVGLIPIAAYRNTTSSACLGTGLFMKGIDLNTMTPICVAAPSGECSDNEVPTGYNVVATSPGSQFFEIQWICSPSNKLTCPSGYVLESINPRQFLDSTVAQKSRCVFGGVASIVVGADEICPVDYESVPFLDPTGIPKINCLAKAPVNATVVSP